MRRRKGEGEGRKEEKGGGGEGGGRKGRKGKDLKKNLLHIFTHFISKRKTNQKKPPENEVNLTQFLRQWGRCLSYRSIACKILWVSVKD